MSETGPRDATAYALQLIARYAALPDDSDRRAVFAYLAGRVPEHAAEALRLNEPAPQEASR